MQNARGYQVCEPVTPATVFSQVAGKSPSIWCPSELMKTMLFISGLLALVQALLIVVTGAFEVYNSYRYTITPISDYDGLGGGTIVLVAPFILFLVALYFFFFLRVHS
jgi:hypothetical protein